MQGGRAPQSYRTGAAHCFNIPFVLVAVYSASVTIWQTSVMVSKLQLLILKLRVPEFWNYKQDYELNINRRTNFNNTFWEHLSSKLLKNCILFIHRPIIVSNIKLIIAPFYLKMFNCVFLPNAKSALVIISLFWFCSIFIREHVC